MGSVEVLTNIAWRQAKWSFVTRRVRREDAAQIVDLPDAAAPGDLVLARVEQTGSHSGCSCRPDARPSSMPVT